MSEEFTPKQLLAPVVKAIDTKHGKDIEVLDIHDISTLGDYFVIATGSSPAQIKAMSDELENVLTKLGIEPKKIYGKDTCQWVLLDYTDIIIHLFSGEGRAFYELDKLWGDAPRLSVDEILSSVVESADK